MRHMPRIRKAWRVVWQVAALFVLCRVGEAIAAVLPLGIPANIVSMVLLFALLVSGVLRATWIADGANFLLNHMSLFLVPVCVSVMDSFSALAQALVPVVLICLVSAALVIAAVGKTVSWAMGACMGPKGRDGE